MSLILKMILQTMKNQPPFAAGPGTDYDAYRKTEIDPKRQLPLAKGISIQGEQIGGVTCEILTPKKLLNNHIIFYIHGGGFTYGNAFVSRGYASVLADECGMRVITISYRLAPEHKFPAAPNDCFTVYREILNRYPESKIALVGESAGGNLVLTTALMAKANGVQMPACICPISAGTNMAEDFPSRQRNQGALVVPFANIAEMLKDVYLEPGADPENPYVSPYYGDYAGFPPMKVIVDRDEVLFDDSDLLVKKLQEAGVTVDYQILSGTFHSFPTIGRVCPESAKILKETAKFIHQYTLNVK